MSKIFRLKEWLTLEDAARHLTGALREEVSIADILQLALEGRLEISVNLVNHAQAKRRLIKSAEEAGTWKVSLPIVNMEEDLTSPDAKGRRKRRKDAPDRGLTEYELPAGTQLDDGRVLTYEDDAVHTIDGVWDLAMFGGERIAVENMLQHHIKGPPVDLINIDGSFLKFPELPDEVWSIQAQGTTKKMNPEWKRRMHSGESTEGIEPYLDQTEVFYYPESGLPEGSMLVVRVSHLQRFIAGTQQTQTPPKAVYPGARTSETAVPFWLDDWFRYDTWDYDIALQLLAGLHPDYSEFQTVDKHFHPIGLTRAVRLDGRHLVLRDGKRDDSWTAEDLGVEDELMGLDVQLEKMRGIWLSGDHPARNSPEYFVQWAVAKRFDVAWLDYARREKFLPRQTESPPADSSIAASDSFRGTLATGKWPWGNHSTELLEHLQAAAERFWKNFDPADPSTGPTNEMVIKWLRRDRGLSENMAKAIATMLRPPDLPTGPRR